MLILFVILVVLGSGCEATPATAPLDADAELAADGAPIDAALPADGGLEVAIQGRVTGTDPLRDAAGLTGEVRVRPVAGVRVEAVAVDDGAVLAATRTDADGTFTLTVDRPAGFGLRARAEVAVGDLTADVRDAAGRVYAIERVEIKEKFTEVVLHAEGAVAGAAFHIAAEVRAGLEVIAPVATGPAHVSYRWQAGVGWSCGSCYLPDTVLLGGGFEDPDQHDDAIILHELGHWFVAHFSEDDSPGGPHRDLQVSPTLAYGEGVAYFFAALVRGEPLLIDSFIDSVRAIDLEAVTVNGDRTPDLQGTTTGELTGALREEVVAGLLWDFFDAHSALEPFDDLALGRATMLALLTDAIGGAPDVGARGVDLADWFNALACVLGPAPLVPLAEERAFPWRPDALTCGKGGARPPFSLVERAGTLWIAAWGKVPPLRLRVNEKSQWIHCVGACRVAPADPDAVVVVSGPGQPWGGASWVGSRRRSALAGGRIQNGLRILPAASGNVVPSDAENP